MYRFFKQATSMRGLSGIISGITLILSASAAQASSILLDTSPNAFGNYGNYTHSDFTSYTYGTNLVTRFSVASDFDLTGMDSYADENGFGPLGTPVHIKIFNDLNGSLGSKVTQISSTISIFDKDGSSYYEPARRYAAFDYFLGAGSYWIGMSGSSRSIFQMGVDLSQTRLNIAGAPTLRLNRDALGGPTYGAAIRVYGDLSVVPLPPSAILFGTALLGLAGIRRRKRKAA